jgi:hypothetical protein
MPCEKTLTPVPDRVPCERTPSLSKAIRLPPGGDAIAFSVDPSSRRGFIDHHKHPGRAYTPRTTNWPAQDEKRIEWPAGFFVSLYHGRADNNNSEEKCAGLNFCYAGCWLPYIKWK